MSDFSLSQPPLICVAARVQFTRVDAIEKHLPGLQEALRLKGYPLADDPVTTKTWRINPQAEAGLNIVAHEFSRWDFANVERTVTLRVDRESLTLFFTDYDHFANAEPHYRAILSMVGEAIPGLLPQQVQLRYVAHIPLAEGSPPTDWVVPSVLGVPNVGELNRQGSLSETSFLSPEGGQLVVRCMSLGSGNLTLPPDFLPLNAKLKYDLRSETPFVLLENLHQRKAGEGAFSAETCLTELSALREHNARVFRATVTPNALESWK